MSIRLASRLIRPTMLMGLLAAMAVAAGCDNSLSGQSLTPVQGVENFRRQVLGADRPVLVDFYKDNCPTCVVQAAELDKLAAEYQGRVFFAKTNLMTKTFGVTEPQIRDAYNLGWVPTTVLFVNGKEKQRWVFNHAAFEFRKALDDAIAEMAAQRSQNPAPQAGPTAARPLPAPAK